MPDWYIALQPNGFFSVWHYEGKLLRYGLTEAAALQLLRKYRYPVKEAERVMLHIRTGARAPHTDRWFQAVSLLKGRGSFFEAALAIQRGGGLFVYDVI